MSSAERRLLFGAHSNTNSQWLWRSRWSVRRRGEFLRGFFTAWHHASVVYAVSLCHVCVSVWVLPI